MQPIYWIYKLILFVKNARLFKSYLKSTDWIVTMLDAAKIKHCFSM